MKKEVESSIESTPTPSQLEAIRILDRNVCVSAGAGTGKTGVLVKRFLRIIKQGLASPAEILAITFTEKAANEMKSRIVTGLKAARLHDARREVESAYIGTIHSFCSRLLKEHPIETGIDPDFRVIEEDEANLLKEIALDQLIEESFETEEIFSLLLVYGEETIRKRVKGLHEKIRISGTQCQEAVERQAGTPDVAIQTMLKESFRGLLNFPKRREQAQEVIQFLELKCVRDWSAIEKLNSFEAQLDLRIKEGREETKKAKDLLRKFVACQLDAFAQPVQKTFGKFLVGFDQRYEALKKERAAFDFNDLELTVMRLLTSESQSALAVRQRYRQQFKFIMVDEFQDTNPVQVRLVELLSNGSNLFLVGDVKQSIYGFRGSDPAIFLKKDKEFGEGDGRKRIVMTENFRSDQKLLDFVNPFFSTLWRDGELIYEPLAANRAAKDISEPVELIEIEQEKDESRDESRAEEARLVAGRIQELVQNEGYDYGDFAMLFRAAESMHLYEQELRNFRVPYYIIGGRGFYHQAEIRDMMNFLTALENPLREIPFAALLRSPMFQVGDDTLFWISRRAKETGKLTSFYNGFAAWREIVEISAGEREKLERFEIIFNDLNHGKRNLNVSEVLEAILRNTHYDLHVLGLAQGKRHFANLRKLVDLARELEARETIHLGDYIRYIKGLVFQEVRESEAQTEAEVGNVVRLMKLHTEIGLEFRCVILPDLARKPRLQESRFLFDDEFGLALQVQNPETGEFENTFSYESAIERLKTRQTQEAKRLLYVAMTRAKEKMILAGTTKPSKNEKEDSFTWFDWVKEVLKGKNLVVKRLSLETGSRRRSGFLRPLVEKKLIHCHLEKLEPIPLKKTPPETMQILNRLKPVRGVFFERIDLPVSAFLTFERDAAHEEYRQIYELGSPSVRTDTKSEEAITVEEEELVSPADFGTLVHKIFEHIVNWAAPTALPLDKWIGFYGRDFEDEARKEVRELALKFLNSQLISSVQKAKRFFTELPFVLKLQHGIIQGTLDLLYETPEGRLVIVDYKTSATSDSNLKEKGESYRSQMELYGLACREILGKFPQRAILYFAKADKCFEIDFRNVDCEMLRTKYESMQKSIIKFRKDNAEIRRFESTSSVLREF